MGYPYLVFCDCGGMETFETEAEAKGYAKGHRDDWDCTTTVIKSEEVADYPGSYDQPNPLPKG